ncbi:MAG: L-fucose/L-arabinose isomerase family protein [Clostridiales Family XIII bacterium]|jgi:L-fucose isomerase-like protein|nr:L-fucose/L-arabinose isomerase family protein [Clostridiales Family XIII bacterium]
MAITYNVKLGVASTRRNIFSREDAIRCKDETLAKLRSLGVDCVDLGWLNEDGLMYDVAHVDAVAQRFRAEGVDALFTPHCNFGNEDSVTRLAAALNVPTLLWGPRDEAPGPDGLRLRDSQCGLFATGKDLLRRHIPFTYIENCRIGDAVFESGVKNFIAAANVVKNFRRLKIGQIDTRPSDFLSVMANEAELAEKFGIHVEPWSLNELIAEMDTIRTERAGELADAAKSTAERIPFDCDGDGVLAMIAMKMAMSEWAARKGLSALAIQCWDALHEATGVMPCFANSVMIEEDIPVACETDLHAAITAVLVQAAAKEPVFIADVTVRHPDNDNAELLWHCGAFPYSLKKEGADGKVGRHYVLPSGAPGVNEWQLKDGEVSIFRFDGIGGDYSLLFAKGKTVDGPANRGTYVWVEFPDWPALERKIVTGPYIHHVIGTYKDAGPILETAIPYLGPIKFDPAF